MAEATGIEWCHHTLNFWIGCTKVSPACDHCYAERDWADRYKRVEWGPKGDRSPTKSPLSNAKNWNRKAVADKVRRRVFVNSLSDTFDNHKSITQEMRERLWHTIRECPQLDFLLLTKRPQNIKKYLPDDWGNGYPNVWLGTTVENQEEADRRIPHLLATPSKIHFLSCEPLLDDIDLTEITSGNQTWNSLEGSGLEMNGNQPYQLNCHKIDWVIAGGESGAHYRDADLDWYRSLRDQCSDAEVPFLFKQHAGKNTKTIKRAGRELDGFIHDEYPVAAGQ